MAKGKKPVRVKKHRKDVKPGRGVKIKTIQPYRRKKPKKRR